MELKKKAKQYIIDAMDWRVEFGNLRRKEIPENYVVGNQRPICRNPLIARTLCNSKDMERFGVVFYRDGTQKLSGTAQKTAQKEGRIKNTDDGILQKKYNQGLTG